MTKSSFVLPIAFLTLAAAGCSHGQCNNVPQRPVASEDAAASPTPAPAAMAEAPGAGAAAQVPAPKDAVQVFKPTGELQCEPGKGTSLETVQDQLTSKKITVYESHTQPDGLMHMAVCGSPTGTIHVFTISKKSLHAAERAGFKSFKVKK
jgi:hypothetical protein